MYGITDEPRTADELRLFRLAHRLRIADVAAAMDPPVSRQRAWQIENAARPSSGAAARYAAGVRQAANGRS